VKILVVGDGGREHAIAWKLLQSSRVTGVFCAPGNGGTAMLAKCCNVPLLSDDFEGLYRFVLTNAIRLVVVGSEVPLAKGITDYFSQYGVLVFGPSQLGAQIEASKTWAKTLMEEAGIPTGRWASFTDAESAHTYVEQQATPIVVKVDGLAAGKGVTVAMTVEEAQSAIAAGFNGQFGDAGQRLIIEEYLTGREISVLALTDGTTICPLIPVQDHKRIGENDTGANTGGMGVYGPIPWVTSELMRRIQQDILEPAIAQLKQRDITYRGVLYAGLMITPDGEPKVIEFNCRFGDPETQVVLPLLETQLDQLLLACVNGTLAEETITWKSRVAACVVAAAQGYPGHYNKGNVITGIGMGTEPGVMIFHAGTRLNTTTNPPVLVTNGGRVLGVTALGDNFQTAFSMAYSALDTIQFDGIYYRRDIGHQVR